MELRRIVFIFAKIACVLIHKTVAKCPQTDGYPYSVFLDPAHKIHFTWDVDYKRSTVNFRLCVELGSPQWFGVGFSNYGELTWADFVVFWTGKSLSHHFQDAHTDGRGVLRKDDRQDYTLTLGRADEHSVILEFYRAFDTCDEQDYKFDTGTTHVVYFIANTPFSYNEDFNVSAQSSGLQRVQLLKPDIRSPHFPPDTWTFDVTAPSIEVPAKETTYWWYTVKIPPLRHKHHIIKYEGVIQKGNENLVHHMEVFHCEVPADEIVRHFNGPGISEGSPEGLAACRKVIGAWAMGASAMVLPDEAGFPLGGWDFSRYVLLEVHYNNPKQIAGQIDSSGIRFYVTSSLRKYDAGIMELGLEYTNKMAIPPGQAKFLLTGYCIKECTEVGLPPGGVYIYASQLHTHLTGRRVYTKHVREGVELPELNRDNHYSPHFQEIRRLPKPVHILPGDELITTCEDRTLDRVNATIGGFAISDEMCVNYVHYYPLVELEVCKSSITESSLRTFFKFMNKFDLADTNPMAGDRANYQAIRWTPLTSLLLKTMYNTSPISMQCNQSDGNRFPGHWEGVHKSEILYPLPDVDRECS